MFKNKNKTFNTYTCHYNNLFKIMKKFINKKIDVLWTRSKVKFSFSEIEFYFHHGVKCMIAYYFRAAENRFAIAEAVGLRLQYFSGLRTNNFLPLFLVCLFYRRQGLVFRDNVCVCFPSYRQLLIPKETLLCLFRVNFTNRTVQALHKKFEDNLITNYV